MVAERDRLDAEVAALQRSNQIDQEAMRAVREELKVFQDQQLQLEEELAFYKGIASSGTVKPGLRIHGFELKSVQEPGQYRYRFTVSQVLKDFGVTEGKILLNVHGMRGGEVASLSLDEVTDDGQDDLKMRFRHFQIVEGILKLPEGFEPDQVVVEVRPENEKLESANRSFAWKVEVSG
jgi:hypothetical protein